MRRFQICLIGLTKGSHRSQQCRNVKSLNACRRAGERRFIECAQLLLAWFHSHFWKVKKVSYRVFSENYSPLKEFVATPRRDNISEEK
ncbi:hypothetical protein Gogos_012330 [Gossypium gossypioides]|uniref:Uncharacterized protein n=1 Tax=Gossypium gossypioides TaxID=34282 RepID=A0A7J9BS53_GOSGO|nr:hypothetical protein [Gossypium gossypioides]